MSRVLLANEDEQALQRTATALRGLGHEVIAMATGVAEAGAHVAEEDPDVSIVVVHRDHDHALALIEETASYATGPVIALSQDDEGRSFVSAAAERGIMAYARDHEDLDQTIEVALHRHAEIRALGEQVQQLEGALERRALIERAKGVLMERHGIDDRAAFEKLRGEARTRGRRIIDLASAVLDGHALLPAQRAAERDPT